MTSRRGRRTEDQRWLSSSHAASVEPMATATSAVMFSPQLDAAPEAIAMENFGRQQQGSKGRRAGRGRSPPQGHSVYREQGGVCAHDDYPDIPTEDFNQFMITLVDGIRSDGAELVASTREAVASTLHVGLTVVWVWVHTVLHTHLKHLCLTCKFLLRCRGDLAESQVFISFARISSSSIACWDLSP